MVDWRRARAVAQFELLEALRSRLLVVLALFYGAGGFLGSMVFLKLLSAAEDQARAVLSERLQIPPEQLPHNLVVEQAMPELLRFVENDATREQLLKMDPLSIIFGLMTLQSVAVWALLSAAGTVAAELASGSARFVLFRCDRFTWVWGKVVGQLALLAVGLLLAVACSWLAASWLSGGVDMSQLGWLLRAAFRSWIYGCAYIGLFSGLSMLCSTALGARALALAVWVGMTMAYSWLTSLWVASRIPGAEAVARLFPAHHQGGLWSGDWTVYGASVFMLVAIGAAGVVAGYWRLENRDA